MHATVPSIDAMGFYHSQGLVPAWKQATQFAGSTGRVGTMLDAVDARLASGVNDFPWNTYFTTASAEYFGYSKGGVRILIVAHGVGPMATLDGILRAYRYEFEDKERNRRGGRIPDSLFHRLEDGLYGEVNVVEFDPILTRRTHAFDTYLRASEALQEPLVVARLGPKAEAYVHHHAALARTYHEKQYGQTIDDPHLFQLGAPNNCFYYTGGFGTYPIAFGQLDKGDGALAHLLSTGRLGQVSHDGARHQPSLANDIGCHEWWNGVRLLGVRSKEAVSSVHPGIGSLPEVIREHWQRLMQPVEEAVAVRKLYTLTRGKTGVLFTQYEKQGDSLDTNEPEFLVTSTEKVGDPLVFKTAPGNTFSFCYDVREVACHCPPGANAYHLDAALSPHEGLVQFYRVEVDTTKRLLRARTLENDFDLLMELTLKEVA